MLCLGATGQGTTEQWRAGDGAVGACPRWFQWVAEETGGVKAGGWSVEAFVPSGGPQTLVARFALAVFCVYGVSDVAGRHHRGLCGIHLFQITSQIHVELLRLF